jgi:hypothetical protein
MLPPSPHPPEIPPRAKAPSYVSMSVREVENDDGAVLLDVGQGLCFSLTPVAAKIWQLLKLSRSLEEITNSISVEFQAPHDQVEKDVAEFLGSLRQHKLLLDREHDESRRGGFLRSLWSPLLRLRIKI